MTRNRKQLEAIAEKLNLELDKATRRERTEASIRGEQQISWVVRTPGYADGAVFRTLKDVEDYLMIARGGQEEE